MARHLIRNQTTGATRIVGSSALPFFPGWVELDNYDDELPPFSYPTLGEGDLRYVNVTEIGDPTSPGGSALRAAFETWLAEAGGGGGGGVTDPETVRDIIAATLAQGTNVTITSSDGADTTTISAAGYTDEQVQDAVAALIAAGTHAGVSFVYNDASNTLSATVSQAVTQTTQAGTTYTLALVDANTVVESNNAAAVTVTVPPNSAAAFPVGTTIGLRQYGAGQVTVAAGSGVTLRSRDGVLKLAGQYAEAALTKRAADEWVLTGDLVA